LPTNSNWWRRAAFGCFILLCNTPSLPKAAAATCIPSGDGTAIRAALVGPGAHAVLCRHAVFEITAPIVLGADGQEISTEGLPDDTSRALIRVVGADLATAIYSRASSITIRNVIVDGARPARGRVLKGDALIEIGGDAADMVVEHVRAYDPRGWSILHVFEGSRCTGARIEDNELGPAGKPDGSWADGISFACRKGIVRHNNITDASDGGIVVFGAPGTVVEDNHIVSRQGVLLGGINLVDYHPFDGDYAGTIVRHNVIEAAGGFIKIGIAIGPAVWGLGHGEINRGASVTDNVIEGDGGFGYGIAIDGARGLTVTGNRTQGHPHAVWGPRCPPMHAQPSLGLVRNPATTDGMFQAGFQTGMLGYSICVERDF
jgi:hypothetical protein